MKRKDPRAVALGKLAADKPKNYSKAERKRRSKLMKEINSRRAARLTKSDKHSEQSR